MARCSSFHPLFGQCIKLGAHMDSHKGRYKIPGSADEVYPETYYPEWKDEDIAVLDQKIWALFGPEIEAQWSHSG